jgi:hypothetical protein
MDMIVRDKLKYVGSFLHRGLTNGKAYLLQLAIAGIFVLPIMAANVDYIDDNARRMMGYYDWASLGRYLTEFIMHVLTLSGATMVDPGRMMQFLSIPVLAFAGYIITRILTGDINKRNSLLAVLIGAILIVNPFLLANLAFRFDSFSMILAYTLAVLAGAIMMKRQSICSCMLAGLIILASAALYQPMVLMTAVVAIVVAVKVIVENHSGMIKRLVIAGATFMCAIGLYYASLIVFHFSNVGGASRGVLVPFSREGLGRAFGNYKAGISAVMSLFQSGVGRALFLLLIVGVVGLVVFSVTKALRAKQWKGSIALVLAPLALLASIMGPFIFMDSALTYQIRTLSAAIGLVLLFGFLLYLVPVNRIVRLAGAFVLLFGLFYCVELSSVFGTSLALQREHDKVVYDEIDDFLLNDGGIKTIKTLYVGGQASVPRSVASIIDKRPILNRMNIAGDNTSWYLWMQLQDDRGIGAGVNWYTQSKEQEDMRRQICSLGQNLIHQNPYYSVYRLNDVAVVWQHSPNEPDTFCSI